MSHELLRQNLKAVIASATAALLALPCDADEMNDDREPPCPKCGEAEQIEDTSTADVQNRKTCLTCGESYTVEVRNA